MQQIQQSKEKIKKYFNEEIEPIFENLITKIAINRPQDIVQYAIKYFKHTSATAKIGEDSDTDSQRFEDIDDKEFNKLKQQKKLKNLTRKVRMGVSSQANSMSNLQRKPISLRKTALKQQRIQIMIRFYFMSSFLFQQFDEQQKNLLVQNMVAQQTIPEEKVIVEGEYGDCMYFIEDGLYECSVMDKDCKSDKKQQQQFLKNYQSGDTFGELCLMHSAKRQASVTSKTNGVIYSLSRQVYKHIKKMSIVKRRSIYIQSLMKVNIFSNLSKQDLQKLCDMLKQTRVQAGQYVIYEGDMGLLVARSNYQQTFYQYYKEGDYFGQLALINKKPRSVSVQAVTKCTVVYLSSNVFLNVINRDKADNQLRKYRDAKPRTTTRRKKNYQTDM